MRGIISSKTEHIVLAPFENLTKLVDVNFYSTHVSNTANLENCTDLRNVSLYMSAVDSIEFLRQTPKVEVLDLYRSGHTFEDYGPLLDLPKLRELNVYMNTAAIDEKLAPLKAIKTLQTFNASLNRKITTIDFLSSSRGMRNLQQWQCSSITDFSALDNMKDLMTLNVVETNFNDTDLKRLEGCRFLQGLSLSKTAVTDLTPLSSCGDLETLEIDNTGVVELDPLKQCTKLRRLALSSDFPQEEVEDLLSVLPHLEVRRK